MDFSQVERAIQDQKLHPIYLAYGPEAFLRQRLVERLLSALELEEPGIRHLNLQVTTGASAEAIVAACDMPTFNGRPRLVIAREPLIVQRADEKDEQQWLEFIEQPSERNHLLILVEKVDKRRRFFTRIRASSSAQLVACERPKGAALRRWIQDAFRGHRKQIDADALRMFMDYDCPLGMLDQEIRKVATYVGAQERITSDDVAAVVVIPKEQNIFAMVDAIGNGDASTAVSMLERMLQEGADPLMVFGMVARQIRLIWQVQYEVKQGMTERAIAKLLALHPFVVSKCIQQSRTFTPEELHRAMEYLLWTDAGIKRGRWSAEFGVQRLVAILAHPEAQLSRSSRHAQPVFP